MNYKAILFPAVLVFSFVLTSLAQTISKPEITAAELRKHVSYLASDALEGRKAGSKGAEKAEQYIADEFKSYGLKPVGDNGTYLQKFEFVSGVRLGQKNSFSYSAGGGSKKLMVDKEYRPFGFSASGTFSGDVVFVGYGISASDKNYDDYKGIDVKDKAVLLLRNAPEGDSLKGKLELFVSLRYKASKAKELGAKALLVVTGPTDSDTDDLMKLSYDQSTGNAGILAVHIKRDVANDLLKASGTNLKDIQAAINTTQSPKSMPLKEVSISLQTDLNEIRETTANVVGFLEGNDPVLKNEIIAIGAHHDHLGYGGPGSGSTKPDTVAVHHGADDNASGTAGLLELAQAFAARKSELKRSILFLSFSGEELGLLGSAYYVKAPTLPLEKTVTMLNMDMIGRLNNKVLIVYGIGTSTGFEELVKKHNRDSMFVLKLNKDGYGPSDHSSFYAKQIPVFHFFTDLHSDYHRPSDESEKINYDGMEQVTKYVEAIAFDLDQETAKPQYVAVEAPRPTGGGGRSTRVYMGTIPDFGEQVEGMKLSGVREGSPAAKAGLQGSDIIIKFGKVDIKNLYDFTYALGEYKPGDEVAVVVKRGKETLNMKVILEKRSN
ncbi:MAG: M28 family peptidase [Ignavibacteriales bacterium]|nr:M28 family peptidase [Ignavibacteriales bacterium]